jgi:hypothetical protein
MTDPTDRETLVSLVAAINAAAPFGTTVAMLDFLADSAPAASVQTLPGSEWSERYIDGSGIKQVPFAVLYRTNQRDSSGRADAAAALMLVGDVADVTLTATPSLTERADNATEVWRAVFVLESLRGA